MKIAYLIMSFVAGGIVGLIFGKDKPCKCQETTIKKDVPAGTIRRTTQQKSGCGCGGNL